MAIKCPKCGSDKIDVAGMAYTYKKCGNVFSPGEAGDDKKKTAGKLGIAMLVLFVIKKLLPVIVFLIGWLVFKNFLLGAVVGCLSLAFQTKGGLRKLSITLAIILFIASFWKVTPVYAYYQAHGTDVKLNILSTVRTAWNGIQCTICKGSTGLANPAACDQQCEIGIVKTQPLLTVTPDLPTSTSDGVPFLATISINLLAKDQVVRNLGVDMWITNGSECLAGSGENNRCVPEEIVKCPTTNSPQSCIAAWSYTQCGGVKGQQCNCPTNGDPCTLKEGSEDKSLSIWFYFNYPEVKTDEYKTICEKAGRNVKYFMIFPRLFLEYDFDMTSSYVLRVSNGDASAPKQVENKMAGPVSVTIKPDKNVYVVGKSNMGSLTVKITNNGDGFATVKNITIDQAYDKGLKPFVITDCPTYEVKTVGSKTSLKPASDKELKLGPRGETGYIGCQITIPTEGIKEFNDYIFLTSVSYNYWEKRDTGTVLVNCPGTFRP